MTIKLYENYLFLEIGLYDPIPFTQENYLDMANFFLNSKTLQFDCYCIECKKESTFRFSNRINAKNWVPGQPAETNRSILNSHREPINLVFNCQRNQAHTYTFSFRITDNKITKVGQYPSMADLELHTIKKYRNLLKNDYRDFSKAIGLYSHGIGAGSFVYLRRIFENLIEETRQEATKKPSWDEEAFQHSKMDEKIKMLESYLPSILVENRKLYSILSKGIHELTEDECLALFPNVKLAIELILDEKIYLLEQQKKTQSVRDFVARTVEKIKG